MSYLQQNDVVDIESANSTNGGRDGGVGHGSAAAAVAEGGGQLYEIGGIVESNINRKGNDDETRDSSVSDCSVEIVDLESGPHETKLRLARTTRDCRICYLSLDATNQDCGLPIELGCSCKDDLAAAHKQCAETWFKIKGNKAFIGSSLRTCRNVKSFSIATCEICGSIAQNVAGVNEGELIEQCDVTNDADMAATSSVPVSPSRNFWQEMLCAYVLKAKSSWTV
ncbi:hypothetical protein OROGR_015910 [Orobanche gracilis]